MRFFVFLSLLVILFWFYSFSFFYVLSFFFFDHGWDDIFDRRLCSWNRFTKWIYKRRCFCCHSRDRQSSPRNDSQDRHTSTQDSHSRTFFIRYFDHHRTRRRFSFRRNNSPWIYTCHCTRLYTRCDFIYFKTF